jgi:multicomponent Na+:H+ antiporter subunit G
MILQAGWSLAALKLLFILAIFFFTLPVAAHALARAALHEGVKPTLVEDRRKLQTGDQGDAETSGPPRGDS